MPQSPLLRRAGCRWRGPWHCQAVEGAGGEADRALSCPWGCAVRCLSTPPPPRCFFLSHQGASLTRWVAPRMPGQPRCSASPWQKDTPSLCSAWMPPTSCSSPGPKVRGGQGGRGGCWPAGAVGAGWRGGIREVPATMGWFLLGLSPALSAEPCPAMPWCWGWLPSSGTVGGGSQCSGGVLPPRDQPPLPSLTLLGTFLLPQTGAAKCGTW